MVDISPELQTLFEKAATFSKDYVDGAEIYKDEKFLDIYDDLVLEYSFPYLYNCPTERITAQYDKYLSNKHLELAVGTGYFLANSTSHAFPIDLTILDINKSCVDWSLERLKSTYGDRFSNITALTHDLLSHSLVLDSDRRFKSIALNALFHCLDGAIEQKASRVFDNTKAVMLPETIVYGCTILGKEKDFTAMGKEINDRHNAQKVFNNLFDGREGLESALDLHFKEFTVDVVGVMALFSGKYPKAF